MATPGGGNDKAATPVGSEWLTLGEAAKYLGVAQSTIRKWSDLGHVDMIKTPGGHRRYRRSDLDAFVARAAGSRTPRPAAAERRVLIVDDDDRLREFVRVNLEMEGYTVREASNGEEGLAALDEDEQPDLVLLDVMMPRMDGWEFLQRMQERHGATRVIVFSGQAGEGAAQDAAERGAQGFISKPFNPQELIDAARQVLAG